MIKLKKWFTLIELIFTLTIVSIISTIGFNQFKINNQVKISNSYISEVKLRIDDLQRKSLLWINWYYENKWVTKPDYIKIYCDNQIHTFNAYICDSTNLVESGLWNCNQVDFPSFNFLKIDWFHKKIGDYWIKKCQVKNIWSYSDWWFYIKISLNFPYWKTEYYSDSGTKDNLWDDIIIENGKIIFWNSVNDFNFQP